MQQRTGEENDAGNGGQADQQHLDDSGTIGSRRVDPVRRYHAIHIRLTAATVAVAAVAGIYKKDGLITAISAGMWALLFLYFLEKYLRRKGIDI